MSIYREGKWKIVYLKHRDFEFVVMLIQYTSFVRADHYLFYGVGGGGERSTKMFFLAKVFLIQQLKSRWISMN
jgi:hypothetical protein